MDTWDSHLLEPNSQIPDCGSTWDMFGGGVITARSRHPNGVNVLMMDGSVRLLGNSVTASVWQSIGTRAGREVDENDANLRRFIVVRTDGFHGTRCGMRQS